MTTEQKPAIESYKAELLKEVGEPAAFSNKSGTSIVSADSKQRIIEEGKHGGEFACAARMMEGFDKPFYTSDQVVAAILKAEQRVAEACAAFLKESADRQDKAFDAYIKAGGYGPATNLSAIPRGYFDAIRSGEWRKFVKEV